MKRTEAPKKQPVPFGINGLREDLLPTTPSGDNTASYLNGFPPITMTLKTAGGLPPKGQDMNQILFELSSLSRWASSGAINSFDSSFSTGVAGYPKGAQILGDDGSTIYISTIDDNTSNPNTGGAGWFNQSNAYLKVLNNLSEIASAGASSQILSRGNLGLSALGIGGTGTSLQALDWQTFDFTPGSTYNIISGNMTNVPPGMQVPSGTLGTIIQVTGYDGTTRHVDVWYSTVTSSSYLRYQVRVAGPVGSKTITVRQVWTSADTIPLSNGGIGATTAAGGRATLGLGTASTASVGTGTNQIPDMNSFTFSGTFGGWVAKFPQGLIIQGGVTAPITSAPYDTGFAFPIPFPNQVLNIWDFNIAPTGGSQKVEWSFNNPSLLGGSVRAIGVVVQGSGSINSPFSGLTCGWIAIGR